VGPNPEVLRALYRVSEQLEMDLFPGEPWGGRSPRGLTRVGLGLFSKRERQGHEVEKDPAQLDAWGLPTKATQRKRAPEQSSGAPPLLPLKGRVRRPRSGPQRGGF